MYGKVDGEAIHISVDPAVDPATDPIRHDNRGHSLKYHIL